jgi:hypothetical protein
MVSVSIAMYFKYKTPTGKDQVFVVSKEDHDSMITDKAVQSLLTIDTDYDDGDGAVFDPFN